MLVNEPARVWEIGCGTGLLLQRAPRCASYLGTDFSAAVVSSLRAEVAFARPAACATRRRVADDFSSLESQQFDLVVLNSVVHFPSQAYSRRVLEGAVATLGEGGVVFIGDVRNLRLLEAFHTGVQPYQAAADVKLAQVRERVQRALEVEEELVLDPEYFRGLCQAVPRLSHAEVLLKRGRDANEMTRYRYDVLLYVGPAPAVVEATVSLAWGVDVATVEGLAELLLEEARRCWKCWACPTRGCKRTSGHGRRWRRARHGGRHAARLAAAGATGIEPEVLWEVGARWGYAVRCDVVARARGRVWDVLFEREAEAQPRRGWLPGQRPVGTTGAQANNPLAVRQQQQVVPHCGRMCRGNCRSTWCRRRSWCWRPCH